MPSNNPKSIADSAHGKTGVRVGLGVFACALAAGALAAWYVHAQGLTLSHYDARGHLVVARRVVDSLTPGWRQFGAVWLPLPHLLNVIPAQWDWAYRSGAMAVAINVFVLAAGLGAVAGRLHGRTGSLAVAIAPAVLILTNANVLYLQSTPMTEPLLIGLSFMCLAAIDAWIEAPTAIGRRWASWLVAALVMTRYEGWLIGAGLLTMATLVRWREGVRVPAPLWAPAAIAIAAFHLLSYASTGAWFVRPDFFVPDPGLLHDPVRSAELVLTGLARLAGPALVVACGLGAVVAIVGARKRLAALIPLALLLGGLLPLAAFYAGHPFRIRYMVPLVAACAVLAAVGLSAAPRRLRAPILAVLLLTLLWTRPPFDASAPMVLEAQWEVPRRQERERVTQVLGREHDGTPILASMGSLAHYMHEASQAGLDLRHFLHEGNGDLWAEALRSPRRSVRWVLIEERAEGGDMLAARARSNPDFLSGFDRVVEGGGLVLYRR
jgi:hypothetical protein